MLLRNTRFYLTAFLGIFFVAQHADGQGHISFQPPVLPIIISLNSQGEVSLSIEGKIETPIGSFSIGTDTPLLENGHTLTVVIRDHKVVYSLDSRPFKLTLPAGGEGGEVRYDGRGNTVVYLPDRVRLTPPARTTAELHLAQEVLEAEYHLGDRGSARAGSVKFHAGTARSARSATTDDYEAKIRPDLTAFVDLDGDGHMDALVVMDISYDGESAETYLYPVMQRGDSLYSGEPVFFDQEIVQAVSVHSGIIKVDTLFVVPSDPMRQAFCGAEFFKYEPFEYTEEGGRGTLVPALSSVEQE